MLTRKYLIGRLIYMKSVTNSRKFRARIISIATCIALILCTALSFCFVNTKPMRSSAEDVVGAETGLRFVQVAAGEDFAIGLTYDGRLFGWSLLDSGYGQDPATADSLGKYYGKTPREIPVIFRAGPGTGNNPNTWGVNAYHVPQPASTNRATTIKEIAATRTTAAFITYNGTIYTWGKDKLDVSGYTNEGSNFLLLRNPNDATSNPWYLPYIIDYDYYGSGLAELNLIRPTGNDVDNHASIAAGEYNYIFSFGRAVYSGVNSKYYTYVWGSLLYSQRFGAKTNVGSNEYYTSGATEGSYNDTSNGRVVYLLPYTYSNDGVSIVRAVAGGYTVGINGTSYSKTGMTSLSLRGKNFISSVADLGYSNEKYTVSRTAATQELSYTYGSDNTSTTSNGTSEIKFAGTNVSSEITVKNAVIGNYVSSAYSNGYITASQNGGDNDNSDLVMGRLASGGAALSFTSPDLNNARTGSVYGALGNTALGGNYKSNLLYYDVSLGYDVGYGISAGKLYSWGDDTYGQSGRNSSLGTYADTWATPAAVGTHIIPADKSVISVAAGKQMSTTAKAFNSADTLTGSAQNYKFSDAVLNKYDVKDTSTWYITGALASSGEIYAWNYETRKSGNASKLVYGGGNDANAIDKFAAVYSGYGNNLFAVTTLGKVVRITYKATYDDEEGNTITDGTFVQEIYDDFIVAEGIGVQSGNFAAGNLLDRDGNAKNSKGDAIARKGDPAPAIIVYSELNRWAIAKPSDNKLVFTVDTSERKDPDLGTATIYLNSLSVSQDTILLNDNIPTAGEVALGGIRYGVDKEDRGSLVTINGIGDVYRILDPDAGEVKFVNTTGTDGGTRSLTQEDLALKFRLEGAPEGTYMTEKQIGFMFDYDVVYSKEFGVGIQISPKQSSQELFVLVDFYVARYDSVSNFTISNEVVQGYSAQNVTDNAIYYDYKPFTFRFKINNTPAYAHIQDFRTIDNERDGDSYIPLLDPNNEYNRYYSVALQDVSGGVEALAKYLTGDDTAASAIVNDVIDAMKIADRADEITEEMAKGGLTSYPAKSRIEAGDLKYYLGADKVNNYYADKYQYLLTDRDADILILGSGSVNQIVSGGANSGAVVSSRATISIKNIDISSAVDENIKALATDFNNRYGIYDIVITEDKKLSFDYEIVRFKAVGATGTLRYTGEDITGFNTSRSGNAYINVNISATEYSDFSASNYTPAFTKGATRNINNAFAVFSQPSLRLKSAYNVDGQTIYGSSKATHTYTETITSLSVGGTWTKNLSEYVENVGAKMGALGVTSESSAIYFSFNDGHSNFAGFNDGFHDETNSSTKIVTLTADTITVSPTTAHPINFRVTIQRFHGTNNTSTFGDDEKVTLIFNFTTIADFSFTLSGGRTSYAVDSLSTCNILGGENSLIEKMINITPVSFESKIKISEPQSSDLTVLTVSKTGDTTFNINPISSGQATVMIVATVYDKSRVITLDFNVSGLTSISGSIELIDTSYVYINSLIGDLRDANYFNTRINNYGILYEDINEETGMPNAVYFTNEDGERLEGYPTYIRSVRFMHYTRGSSNPRIAIEFNTDAHQTSGTYYLRVRFADKSRWNDEKGAYAQAVEAGDTVLETTQRVVSAKRIVPGDNGEAVYTISADVDRAVDMDLSNPDDYWYTKGINTEMTIYIPVKMLMSKANVAAPETYKIFLVTSTVEAAKYFNYSFDNAGKNILIHPLYDTPEAMMVNVSVRSTDAMSSEPNLVVSFRIRTEGISTTLPKTQYVTIWLVAFFGSFGVLFIIFLIRMVVYWRRRAKQRALIKRNQELIKMRDRVHQKASSATKEQLVKSKMKMEDPKYAKLFNEMKKEKQAAVTGGVTLENANPIDAMIDSSQGKKDKKKKKGGKKSIADLKAELAAKKAAFAQAQGPGGPGPANAFAGGMPPQGDFGGQPMGGFDPAQGGFAQAPGFDQPPQGFDGGAPAFEPQNLEVEPIVFDVSDNPGM